MEVLRPERTVGNGGRSLKIAGKFTMEVPVFRVYVAQTRTVIDTLYFLDFEEIGFANIAVHRLLKKATHDAKNDVLNDQYSETIQHITVAARARLSGNKIYLVLVHVGTDGDWDPDGCDGLDHLAYSQNHEVAKAFVTFIGGRSIFRWIKRKPRHWGNDIANVPASTNELLQTIQPTRLHNMQAFRFAGPTFDCLVFGPGIEVELSADAKARKQNVGTGLLPLVKGADTTCKPSVVASPRSRHALFRDCSASPEWSAEWPNSAFSDASQRAMVGTSLPPGPGSVKVGPELLCQQWSAYGPGRTMHPHFI